MMWARGNRGNLIQIAICDTERLKAWIWNLMGRKRL